MGKHSAHERFPDLLVSKQAAEAIRLNNHSQKGRASLREFDLGMPT